MSIPNSFLALLGEAPAHGYGLKSDFERLTAKIWPLNVGQVYTTVKRLERDGLVASGGQGEGSRQLWRITPQGRAELERWYTTPVVNDPPARDELALKLLLAIAADSVDVVQIIQAQRSATMRRLQELTKEKRALDPDADFASALALESWILKAEAEIKWLDHCETALRQRGRS